MQNKTMQHSYGCDFIFSSSLACIQVHIDCKMSQNAEIVTNVWTKLSHNVWLCNNTM